MRGRRTRVVVAALVVLGLVGSLAVGLVAGTGGGRVDVPATGPWAVLVGPEHPTVAACTSDPAVERVSVPDGQDGGPLAVVLYADAARGDLDRVLACLQRDPGAAQVQVVQVSRGVQG
ncbi:MULTISPECIES: hypothetical protein [Cellulomonas]|uniref:Uncharacterized protein n=1 Tax=Cellulomonas iranensis TaxID=76862 RepID=A0ABU0GP36_9CELL|nr:MULTISPECIES: hypothetical protein [Cellulomonas]MBO9567182.1 hypothetical protein [Cellulomonas iranensis]MDQ0427127.1 hypothetical protein [Cellulomonas iranensis]TFH69595.1 hypothetical protein E4A51_16300 [Cellulomonas sp. HD19AZ1]UCN13157.1 hypothetical protein LFM56_09440 [Cellulomonas iranensis]